METITSLEQQRREEIERSCYIEGFTGKDLDEEVRRRMAWTPDAEEQNRRADYLAECARLAELHHREYPPSVESFQMDRASGRIIAVTPSRTPISTAMPKVAMTAPILRGRSVSRPREHRRSRSRTAASRGDPPDPDLPSCKGCGETFPPKRPDQRYCGQACRNRSKVRRHRAKARAANPEVSAAGGILSPQERDALVRAPTRIPARFTTRLVRGSRRFEVSELAEELGYASRPMNGWLHWPDSVAMREVLVVTVDLTRAQVELERLMETA